MFGKFLPHTFTIRMFGRGMRKSYRREEKGNGAIARVKYRCPLEGGVDRSEGEDSDKGLPGSASVLSLF